MFLLWPSFSLFFSLSSLSLPLVCPPCPPSTNLILPFRGCCPSLWPFLLLFLLLLAPPPWLDPPNLFVPLPLFVCSLEMAKVSTQTASVTTPVDLNMNLSQSATPTSTPTSMAVLAAASAVTVSTPPPLPTLPTTHYAVPVSSLLGMKTVPLLALNAAAAAGATGSLSAYTAKIPSTSGVKKSDRQKFAPYWRDETQCKLCQLYQESVVDPSYQENNKASFIFC